MEQTRCAAISINLSRMHNTTASLINGKEDEYTLMTVLLTVIYQRRPHRRGRPNQINQFKK